MIFIRRDDLKISGQNTRLLFHGRLSPLLAEKCRDLHISGLAIDFEETFLSDAVIVEQMENSARIRLNGKHFLENGKILFVKDEFEHLSDQLYIRPYEYQTGETPFDGDVTVVENKDLEIKDGLVTVPGRYKTSGVLIKHGKRLAPGIVISSCCGVTLTDVTIHHAAGMGLLCQFCSDVTLERVHVQPSDRVVSATDDAIHLMECRGKLLIKDCSSSGTLDDAVNVHGIYRPVERTADDFSLILETGHPQQTGLPAAAPGDTLELLKADTSRPYACLKVKEAEQLSPDRTRVTFEEALPAVCSSGDGTRVLAPGQAVLEVSGCRFSTLRGRGVLASGLAEVRIRECHFHTTGAAVFIAGGCSTWFETGPVKQAVIENNVFENCCYNRFSSTRETVSVFPDIRRTEEDFFCHGRIIVRNNSFISQKRPQIAILSAEEAVITDNTFTWNTLYPFDPPEQKMWTFAEKNSPCTIFKHVKNVIQERNSDFY